MQITSPPKERRLSSPSLKQERHFWGPGLTPDHHENGTLNHARDYFTNSPQKDNLIHGPIARPGGQALSLNCYVSIQSEISGCHHASQLKEILKKCCLTNGGGRASARGNCTEIT